MKYRYGSVILGLYASKRGQSSPLFAPRVVCRPRAFFGAPKLLENASPPRRRGSPRLFASLCRTELFGCAPIFFFFFFFFFSIFF